MQTTCVIYHGITAQLFASVCTPAVVAVVAVVGIVAVVLHLALNMCTRLRCRVVRICLRMLCGCGVTTYPCFPAHVPICCDNDANADDGHNGARDRASPTQVSKPEHTTVEWSTPRVRVE